MRWLALLLLLVAFAARAAQPVPPGSAGNIIANVGGTTPWGVATAHNVTTAVLCTSTTGSASSTAYTCSTSPTFTPATNDAIEWAPGANDLSNTTSTPTLAVNGASAAQIKKNGNLLLVNDVGLQVGSTGTVKYYLVYDGTYWQIITQPGNAYANFTNSGGNALDNFYACLRKSLTQVCRIVSFGDSIITCYQISPCNYGPYNASNSPVLALRNEFLKQYVQYSTGLRVPFRLLSVATVDGGEGGYTLTSGTVSQSTVYGPQQSGYSLNGQALLTITSGGVLTINVGQGFNKINVYCVQTTTNTGWTVTIGGTSVGTACGTTAGSTQGAVQSFSNSAVTTATASSWSISSTTLTVTTVASGTFATGGVLSGTSVTGGTTILQQLTGTSGGAGTYLLSAASTASSGTLTQTGGLVNSAVTLTATGASSYLGGYEAITTTGTTGVVVDNMGEGAISSAFWTGSTGLGWFNLLAGQVGLCILEDGENDAQNPTIVTPSGVTTNLQTVATSCQNRGASVLEWIPTPYNSSTANQYAWIQLAEWTYGQAPASGSPWDVLVASDAWQSAGVTGASGTGGAPNFIVQDGATAIAQDVSYGLLQAQDSQHPSDYGSCLLTRQLFSHLSGGRQQFPCGYIPSIVPVPPDVTLTAAYTNATTSFTTLCEATCAHTMSWQVLGFQTVHIRCHLIYQVSATAALSMTLSGTGTPVSLTQSLQAFTGATAVAEIVSSAATAFSTAVTLGTSSTATTNLTADYLAELVYTATANATTTVAVQAHPSTGTLTVQRDSYCVAE